MFDFIQKLKNKNKVHNIITDKRYTQVLDKYRKMSSCELEQLGIKKRVNMILNLPKDRKPLLYKDTEEKNKFYFALKNEIVELLILKYDMTEIDAIDFFNHTYTIMILAVSPDRTNALKINENYNAISIYNIKKYHDDRKYV